MRIRTCGKAAAHAVCVGGPGHGRARILAQVRRRLSGHGFWMDLQTGYTYTEERPLRLTGANPSQA